MLNNSWINVLGLVPTQQVKHRKSLTLKHGTLKQHETNNRSSKGCKKKCCKPLMQVDMMKTPCTHTHNYKYEENHVMMQLVTVVVCYLALWFFMKFGPCLRNSVVSPKTGQPIVPGGKPFFLYLTSFHLKRAEQKQSTSTTPTIAMNTAIAEPKRDFKKKLQPFSVVVTTRVHINTHIYRPFTLCASISYKNKN